MSVKINVEITYKDIYSFQKYHSRTRMAGIIANIVAIVFLGLGVLDIVGGHYGDALLWLVGCFIIIVFPRQTMKAKAKKQVQSSDMFQKPLEYEFSERGITTRQDELEVTNEWDAVVKVVHTRKHLIVYMSRVRAMIFPKRCMGEQYEEVINVIRANMPPEKVKIR